MWNRRTLIAAVIAAIGVLPLSASQANAAASAGASVNCGNIVLAHCVEASGQGVSAGSSATGGIAAGVCEGVAEGAFIVEVRCTFNGRTSASSCPGTACASAVTSSTNNIDPKQICWWAKAYFVDPFIGVEEVETSGCGVTA